MRVPVNSNIGIDAFTGGVISTPISWMKNLVSGQRPTGDYYVTQRPAINIFENASTTVADAQGRGIHYWNAVGARYFVNKDTVYKGSYSAPLAATMTAGTDKVYLFEVGVYLVILDPENNQGWYINSATSTTLTEITDVYFPPKQTPALQLAKGGAIINGKLIVGATDGTIWNSASEDPTTGGILDFISAELKPDNLVMIEEHNQHIVGYGVVTMEFFYDNANTTGSVLNVRQDMSHSVGTVNFDTTWVDGETSYFVSQNPAGDLNVMMLSNFGLSKISSDDLDTFITTSLITDDVKVVGSGFTAVGRAFYCLTMYTQASGVISPKITIVLDTLYKTWMVWELEQTGIDDCPIVGWGRSTGTRAGEGILANGDIVTVADDKNPQDLTEAQSYMVDGYIENQSDYITETGLLGDAINYELITGQNDFGIRTKKFMGDLRLVSRKSVASHLVTVQWSDDKNDNFNTGRTLDLANENNKLTRNGRFTSRNFKLSGGGLEQVEISGIDVNVDG